MRGRSRPSHDQTTTPTGKRRLISITDAAAYADVSPRTIRRWIATGRLPGYRVGPRLVKVDLADLDAVVRRIPAAGGGAA
jgi:excisionase family DNA binding protein